MITTKEYDKAQKFIQEHRTQYVIIKLTEALSITPEELLNGGRVKLFNIKRKSICKYMKEQKFKLREIAPLVGIQYPAVHNAIKTINDLLSVNDKLATDTWNKIKNLN